jgi:hypothetical protein
MGKGVELKNGCPPQAMSLNDTSINTVFHLQDHFFLITIPKQATPEKYSYL